MMLSWTDLFQRIAGRLLKKILRNVEIHWMNSSHLKTHRRIAGLKQHLCVITDLAFWENHEGNHTFYQVFFQRPL